MAKKIILITGCSKGGLGDSLARAFHARGHRVLATARNPAKIAHLREAGIETLILDVVSSTSILECVAAVSKLTNGKLDILLNNSGGGYPMPLLDVDLDKAKQLYDLNVWAPLALTQAFIPLLQTSAPGSMIVNNTSVAAVVPMPLTGVYASSKAAIAMMTSTLRMELEPFGIHVIDLRTGGVRSNFFVNTQTNGQTSKLPQGSIYGPARDVLEKTISKEPWQEQTMTADEWAKRVLDSLLGSNTPPKDIWKGSLASTSWLLTSILPEHFLDSRLSAHQGFDVVSKRIEADRMNKVAID